MLKNKTNSSFVENVTTTHNIVVNMVVDVTTRSKSICEQLMFKDRKPLKSKNMVDWKEKE
jgi:hypothetical protein